MREAICFIACLGLATVGIRDASATHASTPCCREVPCTQFDGDANCDNAHGGWACVENGNDAFPAGADGFGCQEDASGNCAGGGASAETAAGCVCAGGMCVSRQVRPVSDDPMPSTAEDDCTLHAVAGCRAAGHAYCTNGNNCGL